MSLQAPHPSSPKRAGTGQTRSFGGRRKDEDDDSEEKNYVDKEVKIENPAETALIDKMKLLLRGKVHDIQLVDAEVTGAKPALLTSFLFSPRLSLN
uniref:Uncharacterized protein n=1 Tax=Chromera velia CCMP2878 TaxID=1169474 RepID=A0A0G4G1I2_9ALVE|eukprot:Cvel_19643.t1-p1 / transcript=Cvel_19643.t1 / gene=Cvel_19643 / organism=Chromera_velia_CCMP2878 / gene_product=hypothetical protein / transcript_product=hypothetical protein / location=Cvel_scaffold1711:15562-16222(-) / protein_length=95 / sequence_SO=supercontig / SO=protein_coding / is_pseudo=false